QLKIRHNPFAKAFQDARERPNEMNNNLTGSGGPQSKMLLSVQTSCSSPSSISSSNCASANSCVGTLIPSSMAMSYNMQSGVGAPSLPQSHGGGGGGSSVYCDRLETLRSH